MFLVRVGLLVALLLSLYAFHGTYLRDAAAGEGERRVLSESAYNLVYVPVGPPGAAEARAVVRRYLAARERGDARAACRQLTPAQAHATAWLLSRNPKRTSAADCERYVLRESDASIATAPSLAYLRTRPVDVERLGDVAGALVLHPRSFDGPMVAVLNEGGRWRIDAQAAPRADWLRVRCANDGYPSGACGCIYDHARLVGLRRWGARYPAPLDPRTLRRAARACT